jgi:hypothetical protein
MWIIWGKITETCIAIDTNEKPKIDKAVVALLSQAGRAELIASSEVRKALTKYTNSVLHTIDPSIPSEEGNGCAGSLLALRNSFLSVAEQELDQ